MSRLSKLLLVLLMLLVLLVPLTAHSTRGADSADSADSASDEAAPLIVIGIGGLLWSDIDPSATPALFDVVSQSDLSSLSVRTMGEITCPLDGWLTLGTGRRTLASERGQDPVCPTPIWLHNADKQPKIDISALTTINRTLGWRPNLGAFGSDLKTAGLDVVAIGHGGALASATTTGDSAPHFPDISAYFEHLEMVPEAAIPDLLLFDAGEIAEPGFTQATRIPSHAPSSEIANRSKNETRARVLTELDEEIGTLLKHVEAQEPAARILLFGPGGTSTTAHLTVLALLDSDSGGRWLRADSTRRDAVLTLTDLNPTLRELLSLEQAADAIGSPAYSVGANGGTASAIDKLATDDAASHVIRNSLAPLMITLGALNLAGLGAALLLARKKGATFPPGGAIGGSKAAALLWRFLAALAIAPLATFIGSGLPWTRSSFFNLSISLMAAIVISWAALSALVLLGPWRRHPLGPIAAAGLITAVVLLADSATGSHLQWVSPLGDTPLVAGRFYGISNPPFTLAYTGALVGLAIASAPLLRRFTPRTVTGIMISFGIIFTVLVASPAAGANVGGTIAAVPGFIVLALLVSQVKITRSGVGFMVFGGIFVFAVFALIDFAQPPENRAHLGRFIARAGQGELFPMLWRKIEASFTIVNGQLWVTIIALIITGLVAAAIAFPASWKMRALAELYEHFPLLRAGVISTLIGISIAVFTNDSGVALAFITLMLLAPLLTAATVRYWFELRSESSVPDVSAVTDLRAR